MKISVVFFWPFTFFFFCLVTYLYFCIGLVRFAAMVVNFDILRRTVNWTFGDGKNLEKFLRMIKNGKL